MLVLGLRNKRIPINVVSIVDIYGALDVCWFSQTPSIDLRVKLMESVSIIVQQDTTIYSLLYFCKLLCMFRLVTPPIIRNT
jgi:hypothetical protein